MVCMSHVLCSFVSQGSFFKDNEPYMIITKEGEVVSYFGIKGFRRKHILIEKRLRRCNDNPYMIGTLLTFLSVSLIKETRHQVTP